jgi:pyruvate dehydrogenase E2 component (dihydrolipoamide acetyltransferase)
VTKEDILRHVEEQKRVPAAAPAGAGAGDGRSGRAAPQAPAEPAHTGSGLSWDEFYTHVEHPEVAVGANDRVEPMNRMTSLIAEHMVISRRISPHVHSYFEIDYSRIDQVRAKNKRTWEEQGVKVTYTAFIAKAVAQALREYPKLNAAVSGNQVVYRGDVNLGVAVALEQGLIVPVVRNADDLSLTGIARRVADLATRARSKKLSPEEVQGGTFTITNPGIFGTVIGFPIINQPQVAIMGVGAVEKRPVVITDEFGNDAIVARKRGFIALGYDHRLVNGADADQFLARVKQIMESFPESA